MNPIQPPPPAARQGPLRLSDTSTVVDMHSEERPPSPRLDPSEKCPDDTEPHHHTHCSRAHSFSQPSLNRSIRSVTSMRSVRSVIERGSGFYRNSIFPHVWNRTVTVLWIVTGIVVTLYGLMYLGSSWDPQGKLNRVPVGVFNNDIGYSTLPSLSPESQNIVAGLTRNNTPMGTLLEQYIFETPAVNGRLKWTNISSTGLTYQDAIDMVDRGDYWGIVYIPSNFSDNFLTNLRLNRTAEVKPQTLSVEYIWDQGRQFTIANFANQAVSGSLSGLSTSLAQAMVNATASNPTLLDPAFLITPIVVAPGRRHAVAKFGINLATYILPLLMWLSSMMSVTVVNKLLLARLPHLTGVKNAHGLPRANFPPIQIALASLALSGCFTLFHTFLGWGIFYILGGDEAFTYGNPGQVFGFLWFFSYACLGFMWLLCVVFGVDGFAIPASLLLIFQLTTSGAIVDHVAMAGAVKIGEGFPFYWGLIGMRAYLLGTRTHYLTRSYLILLAWAVGCTALAIFLATRQLQNWRKAQLVKQAVDGLNVLGGTVRAV
ncbi:uncharacterized protein SPPG_05042 [Spizellomyces punctatus DAOM BR117]|uniref:ABC-2 type transporter transmembrane domain-containing protein n=1 Tax=Spizellomyces punctatus (strain DAOM BR117) TaxID=645134 RepID=A0A0L0HDY4_SPIPD|nr:uncharacterized protein SPPG_05042 [Spizellomyces punctatus DAOM BR117]KNC99660.1 hypothetical protein SPPG_05042 [Spizellomyces punctatus DAOM BR117]|eukprot:XP_016607700.1 hypothetical protein SPPG_05042 [Spizellomyces punctatus DAOM BR117]